LKTRSVLIRAIVPIRARYASVSVPVTRPQCRAQVASRSSHCPETGTLTLYATRLVCAN